MNLLFLGTGGALDSARHAASLLVDGRLLVDCGPGALVQMRRAGRDPASLDALLVTHLHGDHTFGIPFLLAERAILPRPERRLLAAGPPGLEAHARSLLALAFPDGESARGDRCGVDWVVLAPGESSLRGLRVEACAMEHAVPALGYRIAGRLAISGDTAWGPGLEALARTDGALVVDWTAEQALPGHLGREDLGRLRRLVPPDTRVYAVHRSGRGEPPEGILVPHDLEEVRVSPPAGRRVSPGPAPGSLRAAVPPGPGAPASRGPC